MMPVGSIDHVAIAAPSIDETLTLFRDGLGAEFVSDEHDKQLGIRFVLLRFPGLHLELMAPLRPDSVLQKDLDAHGPGFHHMAFEVDDRRSTAVEPGDDFLMCVRSEGRVVTLMDNLIHGKNEPIRESENASPVQPLPLPEGLLRSRRQEQILTLILTDPETEFSLSGLARRLGIPYSSVHREIERAERFGVVKTRRFESLRLARANIDSPYFASLAALLRR